MLRNTCALLLSGLAACATNGGGSGDGGDPPPDFTNGVSTLAGTDQPGDVDGARDVVRFHNPANVAYGPDGLVYVADYDNSRIRAVAADGTTSTVIKDPKFQQPFGLAFAGNTLYVETDANKDGHKDMPTGTTGGMTGSIWRVDIGAKTDTIVANNIGRPRGLAVLSDGRIAATDYEHHVVELVDPTTGAVTPLAGMWNVKGYADGVGAAARFSSPYGIVQRSDGKLIVADYDNDRLRIVGLDGSVTTFTGSVQGFQDGAMSDAKFHNPQGVAIASNGDIYVTDANNFRVRKVSGNTVTTIAGDGMKGNVDADDRMASEFCGLEGISVKPDASMAYVSDGTRGLDSNQCNRVRQIKLQ